MGKEELRLSLGEILVILYLLDGNKKTCFAFYYVFLIEQEESSIVVYFLASLLASAEMETVV